MGEGDYRNGSTQSLNVKNTKQKETRGGEALDQSEGGTGYYRKQEKRDVVRSDNRSKARFDGNCEGSPTEIVASGGNPTFKESECKGQKLELGEKT